MVYLSPVGLGDMAQRPHYFCKYLQESMQRDVVWLDPMPSRLPRWRDFLRAADSSAGLPPALEPFRHISVAALPVEPISDALTDLTTARLRKRVHALGPFDWVVMGKPSRLGLTLFREQKARHPSTRLLWDCMDDMPAFHQGRAAERMVEQEQALWAAADVVWTSSQGLQRRALGQGVNALYVPNGIHATAYRTPPTRPMPRHGSRHGGLVLGYVGSIAPWFDWQALAALAAIRPHDEIRLIGPLHCGVPARLPRNVLLCPPVAHAQIPIVLQTLDWGLIPFLENRLTDAVDPIKYYEYRAAGCPVLSTPFGDMRTRGRADGVWAWEEALARPALLEEVAGSDCSPTADWISEQDWCRRFERAWQQTDLFLDGAYNSAA